MLVNMKGILGEAEEEGYAIGCINIPNMETLRTVVDAAGELNVPIIIGHAQVHGPLIPMESISPRVVEYAGQAKAPVCMRLGHGSDHSFVMRVIRCSFFSIMYDLSALPLEGNMARLKKFMKTVHSLNITVEAELGTMTNTEKGSHGGSIGWTHESIRKTSVDLQQAAGFARETSMDVLAVCFGMAHDIYAEPPPSDIEKVRAIRAAMPKETRMVMHGGGGVNEEQVRAATTVGCPKVNYYSYMVTAASRHIQKRLNKRDGKTSWHKVEEESYRFMKGYVKGVLTVSKNGKQHRG